MSHSQAVELARQGKPEEALAWFRQRHAAVPHDQQIAWDYLTILTWAGRDAEAMELLFRLPTNSLPDYALEAAAGAARNLRRFEEAEELYRQGTERFPGRPSLSAGWILTLAESGRTTAAVTLGRQMASDSDHPDILLAAASVEEAAGNHFEALRLHERILANDPAHREARRGRILAVDALGSSFLAADLAAGEPDLLTPGEWARILSNRTAQAIRWGELPPADEALPHAETDRALALLSETLLDPDSPATRPYALRMREDRLRALRNRHRMAEVVREYEALRTEGAELSYVALAAAGDAFLDLEQPERARALYEEALRQRPNDFDLRMSLFYALTDLGNFPRALSLIDTMSREEPAWLPAAAGLEPIPNPRKLEAETAAVLGIAWAGDLPQAQSRFETMLRHAPGNPDLYRELGNIYAARGWPRRAVQTYRQGLALAPGHSGLQTGLAQALLAQDEGLPAGAIIRELSARTPDEGQIRRLRKSWEIRQKREWRTEVAGASSTGTQFGSRELVVDSILYSQFLADRFRAFATGFYASADFPEGDEEFRRLGFGLEYRTGGILTTGELTYNAEGGRDFGGQLTAAWQAGDRWSLAAGLELFSRETPLRALRHGIEADAASLGIAYRASERQRLGLDLQVMDFSDGNFRRSAFATLRQRLLTRARLQVDAELEVYASKNNRDDAPYFNPRDDFFTAFGMDALWRQHHRPSRSFSHHLVASVGRYWQDGFDPGWTGTALYEHLWTFGEEFELGYGAGRNRRVFDGDPEYATTWHLRLLWRF